MRTSARPRRPVIAVTATTLLLSMLLTACSPGDAGEAADPGLPVEPRAVLTADDAEDAALSTPVEDPYYPSKGDPRFDALHYDLHLRWSPGSEILRGTATIRFRVARDTDRLVLDLSSVLAATEVTLDGAPVTSDRPGDHLRIEAGTALAAGSRHQLVVRYQGHPEPARTGFERRDVQQLGWTTSADGGASTMQEPFGAFTWYPVNDHPSDKALYDATVDVPAGMVGVFGGELVARNQVDGRTVTQWHMADPAASYLVTLGIGDLVETTETGPGGVPISYWLPRDHTGKELRTARVLAPALRWLGERLGPYPFDRAGILATADGSGMETQTLITLNRSILQGGYRQVVVHELAHHWYGDTVTPRTWDDVWMNEGWAMYAQIRWEASHDVATMRQWRQRLADGDQELRDDYGPPGDYRPKAFAMTNVYYCAALMLDQLRKKIGGEAFGEIWRGWPQQHRNSNADRAEFIAWASEVAGTDLEPFITRWLTSEHTPRLR